MTFVENRLHKIFCHADSYVSSLSGDTNGVDLNGHTLYVGGVAYKP